jgi:uncharacterized membrane-anchored protein
MDNRERTMRQSLVNIRKPTRKPTPKPTPKPTSTSTSKSTPASAWRRLAGCAALLLAAALAPGWAAAQGSAAEDTAQKAFDEARQASKAGPADLPVAGKALLKLPAGHFFVPQPQAGKLLNAMGNPGQDPRLQGLVFPSSGSGWFITVRYEDSGHIKDDDARDWNADDLLKSYREGTEASNEERVKLGVPAIEILGWAEKPAYDATTHRLAWAMSSRDKGAPANEPQGVNYNTYVLGREGYFMLNLVTGLADLPQHKPTAASLIQALNFNDGQRYADFDEKTDHVAEYGLAALVVGVAAKKLGFLAVAGLFLAKFAKIIFLAVAGLGAGAVKWFGRKKPDQAPPSA